MPKVPRRALVAAVGVAFLFVAMPRAGRANDASGPPRVVVARKGEAGTPLRLIVRVLNAETGKSIPNAEIYVYQTDHSGYYDRAPDGRERGPRRARLHATGRTGAGGSIVFETIVPGSYPGSGIFRHIHYRLAAPGYAPEEKEILFDEAPRPSPEQIQQAEANGDTVARRVKGADGRFEMRVDLNLQPSKEK